MEVECCVLHPEGFYFELDRERVYGFGFRMKCSVNLEFEISQELFMEAIMNTRRTL